MPARLRPFRPASVAAFEKAHAYGPLYSESPLWLEYRRAWIERFEREAARRPARLSADWLRLVCGMAAEFGWTLFVSACLAIIAAVLVFVIAAGSVGLSLHDYQILPPGSVRAAGLDAIPWASAVAIIAVFAKVAFVRDAALPRFMRRREVMLRWSAGWWQAKAGLVPDPFDPDVR